MSEVGLVWFPVERQWSHHMFAYRNSKDVFDVAADGTLYSVCIYWDRKSMLVALFWHRNFLAFLAISTVLRVNSCFIQLCLIPWEREFLISQNGMIDGNSLVLSPKSLELFVITQLALRIIITKQEHILAWNWQTSSEWAISLCKVCAPGKLPSNKSLALHHPSQPLSDSILIFSTFIPFCSRSLGLTYDSTLPPAPHQWKTRNYLNDSLLGCDSARFWVDDLLRTAFVSMRRLNVIDEVIRWSAVVSDTKGWFGIVAIENTNI